MELQQRFYDVYTVSCETCFRAAQLTLNSSCFYTWVQGNVPFARTSAGARISFRRYSLDEELRGYCLSRFYALG